MARLQVLMAVVEKFSVSQKSGQMIPEASSDQKMNTLATLLFFKIHLFVYHFSVLSGAKQS